MYPSVGVRQNLNDPNFCCCSTQTSGLLSFSCLLSSSFCAFSGSYLLCERLRLTMKKMTTIRTTTARRIPITIGTRSPFEFPSVGSIAFWKEKQVFIKMYFQISHVVCSAQCLLALIDAPVECLLISHSLLIKMNCPGTL